MMHSVLFTLLTAVTLPNSAAPAAPVASADRHMRSGDPVIKVWTDWDQYSRGDNADVHVRTREDGYLIVMQADVDGRVRVIFPLDPGDDDFVRGGKDFKLAGRNGKGTFYVDGPGGQGMVYAAISSVPFRFNDFAQNDHWDYGALYDKSLDSDFENGFTVLVNKMSTGHFDYDIYRYEVIAHDSYASASTAYAGPTTVYGGSPCWGIYSPFCYGGPLLYGYGPYGYGYPGAYFGYGYGGWSFGFSFGFGCCGYGGYPGYGYGYPYYGYGYPYYGYGYHPGYGYPYYGYPGNGYGPHYGFKPGNPMGTGGTGIGYRPPLTTTPGSSGFGHTGTTMGTPYRPQTTGTPAGFLGPAVGTHGGQVTATHAGFTLGGRGPALHTPTSEPRHMDAPYLGRRNTSGNGQNGSPQSAQRPQRYQGPPRYEPGRNAPAPRGGGGPMTAQRGGPSGPASAPRGGGAPAPHYGGPSAPHGGGGAPAAHPSGGGGGGGMGHRVP